MSAPASAPPAPRSEKHQPKVELFGRPAEEDPPLEQFRIVEGLDEHDRGYVVRTWTDSFHRAPGNHRQRIAQWKHAHHANIDAILALSGTRTLVARHETARAIVRGEDRGPAVLGWIVWTIGRGWPAVHYAYVRHELEGEPWRRRGVLTALVEVADLGPRVVYTHQGEHARGSLHSRARYPRPLDEEIAAHARRQGVSVAHVPIAEWLR